MFSSKEPTVNEEKTQEKEYRSVLTGDIKAGPWNGMK